MRRKETSRRQEPPSKRELCARLLRFVGNTSAVRPKYVAFRWWNLRGEIEARGGGDVVTSLTTSNEEIAPQSPRARRVAGDAASSVSRALLSDITGSPALRPLTSV